jgi:two-component system CheB/CheR fusion protein
MVTKEYLQTTVQELEAANEELQSSNEELQSSNEELQSSNEELETSKEELQSTNEELATVNDELQHRITQVATSNDDLQNLLANLSTVVMIVGLDLKIRRFGTTAEKILNMIPGDIGRSVSYLDSVLRPTQVEQAVSETINTMTVKEQRVRIAEGTWYTMRTSPYRTAEHAIRGAVIELTRMTSVKKGDLPAVSEIEGRILSALPFALVLLDPQLRITYANKRFFEAFQFGAEILGIPLDEMWAEDPEHQAFWQALQATSATGAAFQDLRVPHPFGRAQVPEVRCAGSRVAADGDRATLTLLAISEAPPSG